MSPALTPASKLVLDLPTPEGWKAELTWSRHVKYKADPDWVKQCTMTDGEVRTRLKTCQECPKKTSYNGIGYDVHNFLSVSV